MATRETLVRQRQEILDRIAALGPMRMGSICSQRLPRRTKDGSVERRGPYLRYTFKVENKTHGKHLRNEREAQVYREQIATYHRYQDLVGQFVAVSQRLADFDAEGLDTKKNSSWTSKPSARSRRARSSKS